MMRGRRYIETVESVPRKDPRRSSRLCCTDMIARHKAVAVVESGSVAKPWRPTNR